MLNRIIRLSMRGLITTLLGFSNLFSQTMSEQLLPKVFPNISSTDITIDSSNNIHVMGISTLVSTTYPLEDQGAYLIYYTKVENDSIFPTMAIPDTGYYYNFGLGGSDDIFKYYILPLTSTKTIIGWSKQDCVWGDVAPFYSYRIPKLHFVEISSNSFHPLLDADTAQAPSISIATNGNLHFFWESDSILEQASSYYYSYSGRINHCIRYSKDSVGSVQTIGVGFNPHSTISNDDTVHVIWMHADSSNSEYIQLQYTKGFGNNLTAPCTIYDSIRSWYGIIDYSYDIKIDNNNIVHIGFQSNKNGYSYINAIRISPDGQVQIDSVIGWGAKFYFTDNGIEYVIYPFWNKRGGLAFSSSKSGRLFSQNKYYYFSGSIPTSYNLFTTSKDIPCLLVNDVDKLIYIRDLEQGNDSMYAMKTPSYGISGSSAAIDANNNIWCTYSKKPSTPIQYTYTGYDSVWLLKIIDPVLSVTDLNTLPTHYSLLQNYPNPFNPSTTIQFDLPKGSFVTLKLFNVLGQEVMTLVNEYRPAGSYLINLDGSRLSTGVYLYRIQAGEFVKSKKILLMK